VAGKGGERRGGLLQKCTRALAFATFEKEAKSNNCQTLRDHLNQVSRVIQVVMINK
jgi:hypothetical protein